MKHLQIIANFLLFGLIIISCSKTKETVVIDPVKQDSIIVKEDNQIVKPIVQVDSLIIGNNEIGVGCITEYSRKNNDHLIFVQGSAKNDKDWVTIMKLNGKRELFITTDSATKSVGEDGYTIKVENDHYIIEVNAKIGNSHPEADSTESTGTIKITPKSDDYSETIIEFDGGTAC